ncbi:MAG: hypothetical protein VX278_09850 [Myxococcota bacterium]|nr:hypothetical protein [Myxococcota bacterium]
MNKKIAIIVLVLMGFGWFFRKFLGGHLFSTVVAVACGGEQSRDVETMDPRLRKKIVPIMTSLRDAGFEFQISSVYRSPKRQQCLYDISDQIRKVTGCCGPPLALSDCLASGIAKRDCVVLSEGSCHQRAKVQKKIEGASFSTGRLGGLIPCLGGVTNTTKSCHNNVRKGKPASLAIDLHI